MNYTCTTNGCCDETFCFECTCCKREHCSYEVIVPPTHTTSQEAP